MIRIITILFLLVMGAQAQQYKFAPVTKFNPGSAGVTYPVLSDSAATSWGTSTSTKSVTVNFSSDPNRIALCKLINANGTLTGITVGGVSTALLTNNSNFGMKLYVLKAPSTGSQTCTASFSPASTEGEFIVEAWTNANQGTTWWTSISTNGTSSAITGGNFTVANSSTVNDTVSSFIVFASGVANPVGSANSPTVLIQQINVGNSTELSVAGYTPGTSGTVTSSLHTSEAGVSFVDAIGVSIKGP